MALDGETMGDLLNWAVYAAGRFNRCSAAALGSNYRDTDKSR